MKQTINRMIIISAVMLTWVAACNNQNDSMNPQGQVTGKEVQEEAAEAVDKAVAYTRQQKDAYLEKMETRLNDLDQEINAFADEAKENAGELKNDSREALNNAIETMQSQKQTAMDKLTELEDAGDETWDKIKASLDDTINELEKSFNQARNRLDS